MRSDAHRIVIDRSLHCDLINLEDGQIYLQNAIGRSDVQNIVVDCKSLEGNPCWNCCKECGLNKQRHTSYYIL